MHGFGKNALVSSRNLNIKSKTFKKYLSCNIWSGVESLNVLQIYRSAFTNPYIYTYLRNIRSLKELFNWTKLLNRAFCKINCVYFWYLSITIIVVWLYNLFYMTLDEIRSCGVKHFIQLNKSSMKLWVK